MKLSNSLTTPCDPQFSPLQSEIFRPSENEQVALRVGPRAFPDLYALLEMPRDASACLLDEAIFDLASQVLSASFARSSEPRMQFATRLLPLLRVILLDPTRRASYDATLRLHENGVLGAPSFAQWLTRNLTFSAQLRQKRQAWNARVRQNLANQPYL